MEDNLFVPFGEFTDYKKSDTNISSSKKVIKKSMIQFSGERMVAHENGNGNGKHGITCIPKKTGEKITAIDIKCSCGQTARISLEYGDQIS